MYSVVVVSQRDSNVVEKVLVFDSYESAHHFAGKEAYGYANEKGLEVFAGSDRFDAFDDTGVGLVCSWHIVEISKQ